MYAQKSDKFWTSEENFFVYRNYFILVLHGPVHSGAFATSLFQCYSAFYLVLNHATFKQIKKRHSINDSDGFYIGLLYAVPLVLS